MFKGPRINTGKFGSKKFDPNKASNKYRCVNFTETSGGKIINIKNKYIYKINIKINK